MSLQNIKLNILNNSNEILLQVNQTSGTFSANLLQSTASNGNYNINNTQSSINSTTGGIISYGGISIANTNNVASMTEGGALTIAGGMSLLKDIQLGGLLNGTSFDISTNSISSGNLYLSGNLQVGGSLTIINETVSNSININVTASNLFVSNTLTAIGNSNTLGNIFTNNGNVGIGTTNPNAPLQISNAITNRTIVVYEDNNNDHQYHGFGVNPASMRYQVSDVSGDHVFYAGVNSTTSNELFRIKGSGNVIIAGTTNSQTISTGNLFCTNQTIQNSVILGTLNANFNSNTLGNLFTTNGNVGINTTAPAFTLDINSSNGQNVRIYGSGNDSTLIRFENTSNNGKSFLVGSTGLGSGAGNGFVIFDQSNGSSRMLIGSSGNVGFGGQINPSYTLDVTGTARFTTSITTGVLNASEIKSTNNLFTNGTITNLIITNLTSTNSIFTNSTLNNVLLVNTTSTNFIATNSSINSILSTNISCTNLLLTNGSCNNFTIINSSVSNLTVTNNTCSYSFLTNSTLINTIISLGTASSFFIDNSIINNSVISNLTANNLITTYSSIPSLVSINITTSNLIASAGLTTGNINFTGSLYQNGVPYVESQWTGTNDNIFYGTSSNISVGIGTSNPSFTLDVNGVVNIKTSLTTSNVFSSNVFSSNIVTTNISSSTFSGTNITIGNVYSNFSIISNCETTNISSSTINVTNITASNFLVNNSNALNMIGTNSTITNTIFTNSTIESLNAILITSSNILVSGLMSSLNLYSNSSTINNSILSNVTSLNSIITNCSIANSVITNSLISNSIINNLTTGALVAIGDMNTLGNLYTSNGKVFIGNTIGNHTFQVGNINSSSSSKGNISITNNVDARFHVYNNNLSNTEWLLGQKNQSFTFTKLSLGLEYDYLTFDQSGNVGIGTTSPNYLLDISGSMRINNTQFSSNSTTGALYSLGGLSISGTNANSNTFGGGITVNGGIAISQDAYIGSNLYINNVNATLITGLSFIGSQNSTGVYQLTISIGKTMSNTSYKIIGTSSTTTNNTNVYCISFSGLTTTSFTANILRLDAFQAGFIDTNLYLSWTIYP